MFKNFKKLIFKVKVKSGKTAKFIVLENFLLYGRSSLLVINDADNTYIVYAKYICTFT